MGEGGEWKDGGGEESRKERKGKESTGEKGGKEEVRSVRENRTRLKRREMMGERGE